MREEEICLAGLFSFIWGMLSAIHIGIPEENGKTVSLYKGEENRWLLSNLR